MCLGVCLLFSVSAWARSVFEGMFGVFEGMFGVFEGSFGVFEGFHAPGIR